MQTLKKRLKNRAFILIGTLILIVFILGNFLLGYRIIYKKGETKIKRAYNALKRQ